MFLCVVVGTMTGIKILKQVGLNLFQGTKKLKMVLLKELLRDCHRDVSNPCINLTQINPVKFWYL